MIQFFVYTHFLAGNILVWNFEKMIYRFFTEHMKAIKNGKICEVKLWFFPRNSENISFRHLKTSQIICLKLLYNNEVGILVIKNQ